MLLPSQLQPVLPTGAATSSRPRCYTKIFLSKIYRDSHTPPCPCQGCVPHPPPRSVGKGFGLVHISGGGAGWDWAGRAPGEAPVALRGPCFSPGTRQDQTTSFQELCFLKKNNKKPQTQMKSIPNIFQILQGIVRIKWQAFTFPLWSPPKQTNRAAPSKYFKFQRHYFFLFAH